MAATIGCGDARAPAPAVGPSVRAEDVAFLVPLEHARTFLPASRVLPRTLFDRLHPLTVVDEPDALYDALSVISVRLDACFREGANPGPCQPQVRLVLQPVLDEGMGLATRDAAAHVFYATTTEQVVAIVRALAVAREARDLSAPSVPGGPHPGFADASWRAELVDALSPVLTEDRIVRITSMSVHASNEAWIFAGVDRASGTFEDISIPTLGPGVVENHVTSTGRQDTVAVTLDPVSPVEGALSPLIAAGGLESASAEQRVAAVGAMERLEDPASHNPGTVDCASCHVAALTKLALVQRGFTTPGAFAVPEVYRDTRNLRAYGFFFELPAISPRVTREIELVRSDFSQRLQN